MAKTVGIGNQNFEVIQENRYFYVDKTQFIEQWWETGDNVTLITRPRRFGKTLNMSMVENFFPFSIKTVPIYFRISGYGNTKISVNCRELTR